MTVRVGLRGGLANMASSPEVTVGCYGLFAACVAILPRGDVLTPVSPPLFSRSKPPAATASFSLASHLAFMPVTSLLLSVVDAVPHIRHRMKWCARWVPGPRIEYHTPGPKGSVRAAPYFRIRYYNSFRNLLFSELATYMADPGIGCITPGPTGLVRTVPYFCLIPIL